MTMRSSRSGSDGMLWGKGFASCLLCSPMIPLARLYAIQINAFRHHRQLAGTAHTEESKRGN
jgi:hypothetical protein